MKRGYSELDLCPLASVLRPFRGNHVVRHRAGILAAVHPQIATALRVLTLAGTGHMIRREVTTDRRD